VHSSESVELGARLICFNRRAAARVASAGDAVARKSSVELWCVGTDLIW